MTLFPDVRDADGDRFMNHFIEAMKDADPQDMAYEVKLACEFIEGFRFPDSDTEDRVNNATYAITQVVGTLARRVRAAEAKLKAQEGERG